MAQEIKQSNIFGRVGQNLGKSLAEMAPKESERYSLSQGLKQLGEKKGLTPFEQFSELSSIRGITPQMVQSGSELLKQQARGEALSKFQNQENQPRPSPFPSGQQKNEGKISTSSTPSLTKEDIFAKTQEGYIPPTIEDRDAIAGNAYNANPAFFGNDPQKAIDWADSKISQEEKIAGAYQSKHENLSKIQDNVVNRLKSQSDRLNTKVPSRIYSKIEDQAVQATKSKKDGGEGLTEQQAMKDYGEKLDDASRKFQKINDLGGWGVTLRPASNTISTLNQLQKDFEDLDASDEFASEMQSNNQISPQLSYAIAQPVKKVSGLNNTIKNLPDLEKTETLFESKVDPKVAIPKTLEIAPKLAKFIKENEKASPLAIAYEIEKKGYDSATFLKYLAEKANDLNLKKRQSDQVATPINIITPWNDWWLSSFSGLE